MQRKAHHGDLRVPVVSDKEQRVTRIGKQHGVLRIVRNLQIPADGNIRRLDIVQNRMRFFLCKIDALLAHINNFLHAEAGAVRRSERIHQKDHAVRWKLFRHGMLKNVEIVPFQNRRLTALDFGNVKIPLCLVVLLQNRKNLLEENVRTQRFIGQRIASRAAVLNPDPLLQTVINIKAVIQSNGILHGVSVNRKADVHGLVGGNPLSRTEQMKHRVLGQGFFICFHSVRMVFIREILENQGIHLIGSAGNTLLQRKISGGGIFTACCINAENFQIDIKVKIPSITDDFNPEGVIVIFKICGCAQNSRVPLGLIGNIDQLHVVFLRIILIGVNVSFCRRIDAENPIGKRNGSRKIRRRIGALGFPVQQSFQITDDSVPAIRIGSFHQKMTVVSRKNHGNNPVRGKGLLRLLDGSLYRALITRGLFGSGAHTGGRIDHEHHLGLFNLLLENMDRFCKNCRNGGNNQHLAGNQQNVAESAERNFLLFEFQAQSPDEGAGNQLLLEVRFDDVNENQSEDSNQAEKP